MRDRFCLRRSGQVYCISSQLFYSFYTLTIAQCNDVWACRYPPQLHSLTWSASLTPPWVSEPLGRAPIPYLPQVQLGLNLVSMFAAAFIADRNRVGNQGRK